ncbi:DinI-like family protein [Phytobacter palmae]|nr:DinI-like family protein [Phytobacter palmae]
MGWIMKIELTIDRTKELPKGVVPALEKELLKRLNDQYENCNLVIRRTGSDGLTVFGGDKDDKRKVEKILQETWESADDWFY